MIKQIAGFSADDLIRMSRIIFSEYGFPSKLTSGTGTNFTSEKLHNICRCLNIHHVVSSSYNHHSNGHAEGGIMLAKNTIKSAMILILISV